MTKSEYKKLYDDKVDEFALKQGLPPSFVRQEIEDDIQRLGDDPLDYSYIYAKHLAMPDDLFGDDADRIIDEACRVTDDPK